MKNVIVLDNGGETFDRYTILNKKTGDLLGSSENPFWPQGFGQHCGNVADNYWNVAYGYSWRKRNDVKKCTRFAVNHFLNDCTHVGKQIDFNALPDDVKRFVLQSF